MQFGPELIAGEKKKLEGEEEKVGFGQIGTERGEGEKNNRTSTNRMLSILNRSL